MKKYIIISLFFITVGLIFKSQIICLDADYEDKCVDIVNHVFEDYIYLRSSVFSFKGEKEVISSLTLKRNVLYIFNVCEEDATDNMILHLFNENDSLLSSSIHPITKKNTKIIAYYTTRGGRYYISTNFPKKKKTCCLVLLGMITKNIEQYISKK